MAQEGTVEVEDAFWGNALMFWLGLLMCGGSHTEVTGEEYVQYVIFGRRRRSVGDAATAVGPALDFIVVREAKISSVVGLWDNIVAPTAFCDHGLDLSEDLPVPCGG